MIPRMPHRDARAAGASLAMVAAIVAILPGCRSSEPAPEKTSAAQHFDHGGFRVQMTLDPAEGRTIVSGTNVGLRFTVSEAQAGGEPIAGLFPLAWLLRRNPGEQPPDRAGCKRQIQSLLRGRLSRVPEVNLNEYYLVTLDDNNSISIIDPQIESSKTKTVGMISLPSKGVDFALAPDRDTVLVSLMRGGLVAAANIRDMRARHIRVGGRPRRIALQPDARLAWVGDFEGEHVAAIGLDDLTRQAHIEVGPGPHELAFRADSGYVYVASPRASALHIIDARDLRHRAHVDVGTGAVAVAASAHSRNVYVALARGAVVAVDDDSFERVTTIDLDATLTYFALSPGGRWGFALDRDHDRLHIIDTATNRAVHSIATHGEPDRVDFTESFAYVRHAASARYLLVDLSTLGQNGAPQLSDVAMGQAPPGQGQDTPTASTLAILPEGSGAMLLNPADRSVYHFMEGMLAPMGSYRLYPWRARGLLLADRSLRERDKGTYHTSFAAPGPGIYTVPFLVATSPRIYDCSFTVEVRATAGDQPAPKIAVDAPFTRQTFVPGAPSTLEVALSDPDTGAPLAELDDVLVLVFRGTTWQWRGPARPREKGRYQVSVRFPGPGRYVVMLQVPSRGVRFQDLPWQVAEVGEK